MRAGHASLLAREESREAEEPQDRKATVGISFRFVASDSLDSGFLAIGGTATLSAWSRAYKADLDSGAVDAFAPL